MELIVDFFFAKVWLPGIGGLSTVLFGTIFSFLIIAAKGPVKVHAKLLSKPMVRMWTKFLGEEKMSEWIDTDEKVLFGKEKENASSPDKDKNLHMMSIPKAKLVHDSPYTTN